MFRSAQVPSYQEYTDTIIDNCTEDTLQTERNSGKPKYLQNKLVNQCLPQRISRTVIKVSWNKATEGDCRRNAGTRGPCCGLESQ